MIMISWLTRHQRRFKMKNILTRGKMTSEGKKTVERKELTLLDGKNDTVDFGKLNRQNKVKENFGMVLTTLLKM